VKEYRYKALTTSGETVSGLRRAADVTTLTADLIGQNLVLLDSRPTLGSLGKAFSFGGRAGRRELRAITLHLATSLGAGIPVVQALRDFEEETQQGALRDILTDLREEISSGTQLDTALHKHPEVFPEVYIAMVTAGQESGKVAEAFTELVEYLDWLDDLQGKTKQAMVYPAILFAGVVGLFMLMMLYVLPRFTGMFEGMNVKLPALTQHVMNTFDNLKIWWPLLGGGTIAIVLGWTFSYRTPSGRYALDLFLLRLPVLGSFLHKLALSRFSRHFTLLFASGTNLLRLLILLQKVVGNAVMARELEMVHARVTTGQTLAAAFAESQWFPPLIQRLIAVGEKTGRLDDTLQKAADYLDKEIPRALKQAFTLLEAIIVAILGALIAISALSILLPIFELRGNLVN
jgi:type IV pilus assembly protein PilC